MRGEDVESRITAHHEAGHAVAACLRGGGEVLSISIERSDHYLGLTNTRSKRWDTAFIIYAGPWAQARARWPLPTLGGEDEDGCNFDDYLVGAWLSNYDDNRDYRRLNDTDPFGVGGVMSAEAQAAMVASLTQQDSTINTVRDIVARREQVWDMELDHSWPAITRAAEMLLAGPAATVTTADIYALLECP